MIAAVSPDVSTPSRHATTTKTGWHFSPVPDLNRETKHQVTKASAWPTFTGICFALRQEGRKGRTASIRRAAKEDQKLSVGLRHLARDMGLNVSTVRRQVRRLEQLGLVVIFNPNVRHHVDPATGRIFAKSEKGRCENTRVYLTIQPHHLRPAKATAMGAQCAQPAGQDGSCKVQSAPIVRDSKNQRTPDGDACGIGTPPAGQAGRLPAAKAAGHAAGDAGHERPPIVPLDAGRDEPDLPPRLNRAGKAPTNRRTNGYQEGQRGQEERRSAAEAAAAWHRRDPQQEARTQAYLEAKAQKATKKPQPADQPASRPPAPPDDKAAKAAFLAVLGKAVS